MPFTFSHTAVVIPFLSVSRKWISITGIIIGSMTPDFEYFLRMRIKSDYSHTLSGMFWFDLPLCLLVAFIFHNVIRNPLINNLPLFLKQRFYPYTAFNWNAYCKKYIGVVLISSLIGIFSHCLWDSFTHPTGYFVEQITALQSTISVESHNFYVYKLIQYSSGLVGGIGIMALVFYLPRSSSLPNKINPYYWWIFFMLLIIITIIRFIVNNQIWDIGNLVVTLIAAAFVSLILVSYIFTFSKSS